MNLKPLFAALLFLITFLFSGCELGGNGGEDVYITLGGDTASCESNNVAINGGNVKILRGGSYVVSGALSNGTLTVDSDDESDVFITLKNAEITSESSSALYIKKAKRTVITLADGTKNLLCDGDAVSLTPSSERPSAALFSKDDLVINGGGELSVSGNFTHAIHSGDSLEISDANITVTSRGKGIDANDFLKLKNASVTAESEDNAISCDGDISISGGNFSLSSFSKAIHSDKELTLFPESLEITKSKEGIEGAYVTIDGGDISISARDDGISANAQNKKGSDILFVQNGGNIVINTSGDGFDSNGSALLAGGSLFIFGPEDDKNGSIDYDIEFFANGGSLFAAGSSGMAKTPSEKSSQRYISVSLGKFFPAGSEVSVCGEDGKAILTASPLKSFEWICVSADEFDRGDTYSVKVNGETVAEAPAL